MSQRSGPFGDAVRGPALNQAVATLGSEQDLPPVSGELTTDPAAQPATADDFGHIVHRTPQYVLKPASAADISATVAWAASQGLKVAARGQGHSTYGRPMVPEGVVVDMSTLNTIHSIASDRMVVDAGAKWSAVIDAALARGLTPPVLTAYTDLSVGGTLSVGGIGGDVRRAGEHSPRERSVVQSAPVVADVSSRLDSRVACW
jgi:cytokinin dehydrogenase